MQKIVIDIRMLFFFLVLLFAFVLGIVNDDPFMFIVGFIMLGLFLFGLWDTYRCQK